MRQEWLWDMLQRIFKPHSPHWQRAETLNLIYYDIIAEFYAQTNVPIIFNTSFNLGGEPLVETLDDAIRTLYNSEMEYCYLPEYSVMIEMKN